ncbi:NKAP domain containing 1 isoform X2 [Phycodurus eques]|uniref:NKAP domain containing 1 isoform X2 n=1 Tax=Phycodurus eques TaxID=693459 RepID=UPI002ACDB494|nr:NKAP domain containing 1 isoform X2 [Phycodurus eques]
MSKQTLGKTLLRNVIRHTDAHNKIQEESEMWKMRGWEVQMSNNSHVSATKSIRGQMHCDRFSYQSRVSSEHDDREARYWTRKLYDFEDNDPDSDKSSTTKKKGSQSKASESKRSKKKKKKKKKKKQTEEEEGQRKKADSSNDSNRTKSRHKSKKKERKDEDGLRRKRKNDDSHKHSDSTKKRRRDWTKAAGEESTDQSSEE